MSESHPNYASRATTPRAFARRSSPPSPPPNADRAPSYGDDAHSTQAKNFSRRFLKRRATFSWCSTATAANALALAAICQRHHSVVCHEFSHVENDEGGAPEFFTGGSKVLPIAAPHAKLRPADFAATLTRGHGVHFPKPRALSLTQSTELGRFIRPPNLRALTDLPTKTGSPCMWMARVSPTPPQRCASATFARRSHLARRGRCPMFRRHEEAACSPPRPWCFSIASSRASSNVA